MEGIRQSLGSHKQIHASLGIDLLGYMIDHKDVTTSPKYPTSIPLDEAIDIASGNVNELYGCDEECINAQLSGYYNEKCGIDGEAKVHTVNEHGHKYQNNTRVGDKVDNYVDEK